MRTRVPFLAPILALLLAPLAQAQEGLPGGAARFEAKLTDLAEHARERTVLVYGLIGLGSGAVVTHSGMVVTNAHVVAGARYAILQWEGGKTVLARRLGIDYGRDLAVLVPAKPLASAVPAFGLAERRPAKGSWVLACGFPGGLRTTTQPTVSLGRVIGKNPTKSAGSNVMGFLNYGDAIRSDVPIFSGNSGGPMIDLRGRLVGINGAVDLQRAASMTIPIELVRERIARLKGGVVVLPNGSVLDPRRNAILRGLYDALDPLARQMPKRLADASKRAARAGRQLRDRVPDRLRPAQAYKPNDKLANIARKSPRQGLLDRAWRGPRHSHGLVSKSGLHLTVVGKHHAVCKASYLQGKTQVQLHGRVAKVVARSEPDDLALLELPHAWGAQVVDAPLRPVGSIVFARSPKGTLASGIVSAAGRSTSSTVLARIQSGGGQMGGILRFAERMAKSLRIKQLQDLIEQIRKSMEMRRAFSGGTPPRDYHRVLSVDAPLAPSTMGAPVYDRDGRLIGVSIGIAHHGTSYVVPMLRVRRAFHGKLPGPLRPNKLGKAKLY